jgi:hypothetical protein
MEFKNKSNLDFKDISSNEWREYHFPNKEVIRLEKPLWLHVSKNGHRVFTEDGLSHYIPNGWLHLTWKADPHFSL